MIKHTDLGNSLFQRSKKLYALLLTGDIQFAGNSKLKIYGLLSCSSGKRMKVNNRVFFKSVTEAEREGYRPCGHCMREAYNAWKTSDH